MEVKGNERAHGYPKCRHSFGYRHGWRGSKNTYQSGTDGYAVGGITDSNGRQKVSKGMFWGLEGPYNHPDYALNENGFCGGPREAGTNNWPRHIGQVRFAGTTELQIPRPAPSARSIGLHSLHMHTTSRIAPTTKPANCGRPARYLPEPSTTKPRCIAPRVCTVAPVVVSESRATRQCSI